MTNQTANQILKLGVVPSLLVWLLWTFISSYNGKLDAIGNAMDAHAKETQILIAIGRASCHIASQTPADHASCEVGR